MGGEEGQIAKPPIHLSVHLPTFVWMPVLHVLSVFSVMSVMYVISVIYVIHVMYVMRIMRVSVSVSMHVCVGEFVSVRSCEHVSMCVSICEYQQLKLHVTVHVRVHVNEHVPEDVSVDLLNVCMSLWMTSLQAPFFQKHVEQLEGAHVCIVWSMLVPCALHLNYTLKLSFPMLKELMRESRPPPQGCIFRVLRVSERHRLSRLTLWHTCFVSKK